MSEQRDVAVREAEGAGLPGDLRPTIRKSSVCVLDCPDACSLDVEVRDGRAVSIDGSRRNPLTGGYVCGKVRSRLIEHVYGSARLRQPLERVGAKGEGTFEPTSWDEALATITSRLLAVRDRFGGDAILPVSYGGSNGLLSQDNTDARFFRRLGAARLARTVCAAPSGRAAEGLYGKMPGVALQDYEHAKAIIVWGTNPSISGIHLMPVLQAAQRRGAWLAVVDPRRTQLAGVADLHLAVRPGTDLPVALSILHWLFRSDRADRRFLDQSAEGAAELEERASRWSFEKAAEVAGVDGGRIAAMAERYATSSPAVIRCGWGLERNRNGGSAVAAVLAIPAVAGKFGVRAGGYTMSNSPAWDLDATATANATATDNRLVNLNRVGDALLDADAPVKALFTYNCNPLATLPRQDKMRRGLQREDLFTVVFDQVMTDTARYADVVLPATTFLERAELGRGYGAYALQRSEPAIDPVGESRSNHEVFAELCERAGLAEPGDAADSDALLAGILRSHRRADELSSSLATDSIAFPDFGERPVQFVDVVPGTPDGRVHLVPEALDAEAAATGGLYHYQAEPGSDEFPLALISPASKLTINSTFGQLRDDIARVAIHPDDAATRSIAEGDAVCIRNEFGEVRCRAAISSRMRPGVAALPKGLWDHNTASGNTGNVLVPDSLTDVGGGACFNDTRVQIARLA